MVGVGYISCGVTALETPDFRTLAQLSGEDVLHSLDTIIRSSEGPQNSAPEVPRCLVSVLTPPILCILQRRCSHPQVTVQIQDHNVRRQCCEALWRDADGCDHPQVHVGDLGH